MASVSAVRIVSLRIRPGTKDFVEVVTFAGKALLRTSVTKPPVALFRPGDGKINQSRFKLERRTCASASVPCTSCNKIIVDCFASIPSIFIFLSRTTGSKTKSAWVFQELSEIEGCPSVTPASTCLLNRPFDFIDGSSRLSPSVDNDVLVDLEGGKCIQVEEQFGFGTRPRGHFNKKT